jgi:hypothetical protein
MQHKIELLLLAVEVTVEVVVVVRIGLFISYPILNLFSLTPYFFVNNTITKRCIDEL